MSAELLPGIEGAGNVIGYLGTECRRTHHGLCLIPHFPGAGTQASGSSVRQCWLAAHGSLQPGWAGRPGHLVTAAGRKHRCGCFHQDRSQILFLLKIVQGPLKTQSPGPGPSPKDYILGRWTFVLYFKSLSSHVDHPVWRLLTRWTLDSVSPTSGRNKGLVWG